MFDTPTLGSLSDLSGSVYWSGQMLAQEAAKRAHFLGQDVTAPKPFIVIAHGNAPSFFADLFAVWAIGGCAVCVNQGLTPAEVETIAAFVNAAAVLEGEAGSLKASVPALCPAAYAGESGGYTSKAALDDPAIILFTSGTTGDPKGVVHTHRSLQARMALNAAYIGDETLAKTLCTLPTHFGHGLIGNCLTPLLRGGHVVLGSGGGMQLASTLGRVLDDQSISFMSSVPALWKLAIRLSPPPKSGSLKRIHVGSAPLSSALWQDIIDWSGGAEVVNMYGITETANWIGGASSKDHAPEDGLLGTPWGGAAGILAADGTISSQGMGEIVVQTPSLMSGYFKRPDLTQQVMRGGWYCTGDTGQMDENGMLRLTGRNRYMINNAGIKIYPEELDLLFERHADVAEACAFGVADAVSGEAVALAVTAIDGAALEPAALQAWAAERIRREAVPRKIFIVDQIPKTDRGKINRDRVAAYCQDKADAA